MTTVADPPTAAEPAKPRGATHVIGKPRLRASATRIQLGDKRLAKAQASKRLEWQEEAFDYFDDIGMIKYVVWFLGNQIAKLHLFAAVRPLDDPEGTPIPCTDPQSGIPMDIAQRANAEIARIQGNSGGTSEILRMLNMNVEIAGECYVVGIGPRVHVEKNTESGEEIEVLTLESWDVKSILEVIVEGEGIYKIKSDVTDQTLTLDESKGDTCVRVWQRHPGWSKRADCHMRGVLTDCESLVLLTNEVKAESKSRQSNGLLLIPNTLSVTIPDKTIQVEDDDEQIDAVPDEETPAAATVGEVLAEAIMEPIEDPGSAWSVFPVILIGPAEDLKEVRHVQLHRESTAVLEARIQARKDSIAEGLNAPVEVAKGHMQTTFANAVQIDSDIFEKHLEPRCVLIVDMWTVGLLRPGLIAQGIDAGLADRIICWYDPSKLMKRVDPVESADQGIVLDTISDEAWRRAHGWNEDDAPPPIDRLIRAILHQRTWDPGLVDAVVRALDPTLDVPPPISKAGVEGAPPPPEPPQDPNAGGGNDNSGTMSALVDALTQLRSDPAGPSRAAALAGLFELQAAARALRAAATPSTTDAGVGARFAAIDREVRTQTLAVANGAMTRVLERAGSRIKARQGPTHETLRMCNPIYAAKMLGPSIVASLGINAEDLIDADAFEPVVRQFHTWARHAQSQSLKIAAGAVALTAAQQAAIAAQQAQHLNDASMWLRDNLNEVANDRLYQPDPLEPDRGEFDPSSRVPPGLVRTAVAIAGGALAIELLRPDKYVPALGDNAQPPGGIGTGATITKAILDAGTLVVEGWQWDYGAAFRARPFDAHEALDGTVMESAADFTVDGGDEWLGAFYFPGDHDGCLCGDLIPVYAQAPDEITGGDAGTGMDAPDRGAPLFGSSGKVDRPLRAEYNPDEPRDYHGRWGEGGSPQDQAAHLMRDPEFVAWAQEHGHNFDTAEDVVSFHLDYVQSQRDPAGYAADKMVEAMRVPDGGFTIDPRDGTTPTTGYAVAIQGSSSITPVADFMAGPKGDEAGRAIIDTWLAQNAPIFDANPDLHVGGWHDPESGNIFLDPSLVIQDRAEAIATGIANDQIKITDLAAIHASDWANAFIPTHGTGGLPPK